MARILVLALELGVLGVFLAVIQPVGLAPVPQAASRMQTPSCRRSLSATFSHVVRGLPCGLSHPVALGFLVFDPQGLYLAGHKWQQSGYVYVLYINP